MSLLVGIILTILVCTTPSFSADLTAHILNDENKPYCQENIKDNETCPADKVTTLGRLIKVALYASYPDEQVLSGEEKYRRAELAQSLTGVSEIKLKAEDTVLIKKLTGKLYSPGVVYSIWKLLEK